MLIEQLVTVVAGGTVEVHGLTPELDEGLMYRLMNAAPSAADMEDHHLSAYTYHGHRDGKAVFGRTFFKGIGIAQTNFIIVPADHLIRFQHNPALFSFISSASGLVHNKNLDCPQLPVLDFEDAASRFDPVFQDDHTIRMADIAIEEIRNSGTIAILGISQPFRFLVPLLAQLSKDDRLELTYSVNSSFLPKDENIKLFVFPTMSSTLLQRLEAAGIRTLAVRDVAKV